MKIGIMTYHWATNYGALLQLLALFDKIKEVFDKSEVYIINYQPHYKKYLKEISNKGHNKIYLFVKFILSLIESHHFDIFRKRYYEYISFEDVSSLDYIIFGSDQIWNTSLTFGLDSNFFGKINGFLGKAIAYAASDGGCLENNANVDDIKKLLGNFIGLSVREKSMIPRIQKYTETKPIKVVLDPVFLPDTSFWFKIAGKQKYKNYILVYRLIPNNDIIKDALLISEKTNKKIIEIRVGNPYKSIFTIKHKIIPFVNTNDFLSLFINADYILTNSFHGTAFSIIFHKQFCSYKIKGGISSRITDLLSDYGLADRYVERSADILFNQINYKIIDDIILKKRVDSVNYLLESIG